MRDAAQSFALNDAAKCQTTAENLSNLMKGSAVPSTDGRDRVALLLLITTSARGCMTCPAGGLPEGRQTEGRMGQHFRKSD
jgi:hypothetical protein